MRWTSMELAALATAAVPGLSPTGVAVAADDARDFTSAVVIDSEGHRWRIRSPQHQEAAMRLETELQVLRGFSTGIRAELPFRVPSVAGAVRRGEMRTFVYNHLPGTSLELSELTSASEAVIDDIGRTIAAIHDLDDAVVDNADLPRYSAERYRQRRLNELDQAATTGEIPALLLRRWEHAMEDRELWRFSPAVTHGDLHEDSLLIEGERVVAVTGWTDLHSGDPADDFAWLTAAGDAEFTEKVLAAYHRHRTGQADEHLMRRAALTAEFALAQWLVRGHASENPEMVTEAKGLLEQLKVDIETYGGQPIALTPMEGEEPPAPAEVQDSRPVARAGAAATVADTGEWAESGEDDDEPAVITDSPASGAASTATADHEEVIDDPDATGKVPAFHPRPQPADDATDDATGAIPMVHDTNPDEDTDLPIHADETSERRAKQKNFFPTSASSAASAASVDSATSAQSVASAHSADSAGSADSADSAPSAPSADSPASAAEPSSSERAGSTDETHGVEQDQNAGQDQNGDESIYQRHPGLRPPTS
ncbi:phosphotransferase [Nesterenkonia halotolerans]|uniref:Aminoglycoside phosphotransferase (APT) family kinase protein n=1 Tax=Nesterenkonia halotolerans TaxID=225325 RepID=A0ABR9J5Q1_9MICC|nr:phosphotransferase [Nesterenkonia halotolerans]MBE1514323.1 aminoglycoside phosphotransferase (APT) family kinase protein [Nesterenkonia halotolerans]